MNQHRWILKKQDPLAAQAIIKQVHVSRILAEILMGRNLKNIPDISEFLSPKLSHMHHPHLFYEMKKAAERCVVALKRQEKIFLYGDYDVDGVTSIALLYQCFELLGAKVKYYIPDRLSEGYGVNIAAVQKIAKEKGNLIITVDCGISAKDAVAEANRLGMDVIITDHHEPSDVLPSAIAVVNPKDHRGQYPFHGIAGVGVAFKLAWAIFQELSEIPNKVSDEHRAFLMKILSLVALGTISDVAPLVDENRIMAKVGLEALENTDHIGIKALKQISNLIQTSPLTAEHIGFRLGPRLNAMGRLENSVSCVQLLTCTNCDEALMLSRQLEIQNQKRKNIQEKIYQQAKEIIQSNGLEKNKVLTLSHEDWHPGVIGIVASRLLDEFYRPVLMIALHKNEGRGSARSIHGFHLFQALQEAEPYLISFGGHEMAAGFKIDRDKISDLDTFLNAKAERILTLEDLHPNLFVDAEVNFSEINWGLLDQFEQLAPFGEGNHEPILVSYGVEILRNPAPERYGGRGEHLGFRCRQGNSIFRSIAFGYGELYEKLSTYPRWDLAFNVKKNTWNDEDYIQLHIQDMKPSQLS